VKSRPLYKPFACGRAISCSLYLAWIAWTKMKILSLDSGYRHQLSACASTQLPGLFSRQQSHHQHTIVMASVWLFCQPRREPTAGRTYFRAILQLYLVLKPRLAMRHATICKLETSRDRYATFWPHNSGLFNLTFSISEIGDRLRISVIGKSRSRFLLYM